MPARPFTPPSSLFSMPSGGTARLPSSGRSFSSGLMAVVPVFLLARQLFGSRAAVLAAWICALYPLRIFFEGEILAVTLFTFLLCWGMYCLWKGMEGGSTFRLFQAGLFFGLGVLARPNFLLALPFLLAGGCLAHRGRRPLPWPGILWFASAVLLCLLPTTIHNWRAEGELIPVAGNGGINFYLGNRPGSSGETPLPPGLVWQDTVQEPIRRGMTGRAEQDRFWWQRSRRVLEADPGGWTALLARKGALFWDARESSNNKNLPFFTGVSFPVRHYRLWFGLLFSLAVAALFVLPLRPGPLLLIGLLCGYWMAVTVFFVTARYRLPLVPFLAILAAAGISEVAGRRKDRGRRGVALPILGAVLAAAMVFPGWFQKDAGGIDSDFQMGQVYLSRGEPRKAEDHLLRARARNPEDPDVYNSLGAARFAVGDWPGAEENFVEALRFGEFSEIYFNLGIVYEKMGPARRRDALSAYRRALERNPLDMRVRANLSYLLGRPGR